MNYDQLISDKHIILKEFYIDESVLVHVENGEGLVSINGVNIELSGDMLLIVPNCSYVSCHVSSTDASVKVQKITINEGVLAELLRSIQYITKNSTQSQSERIYALNTPANVCQQFLLIQQLLPHLPEKTMEQAFLNQSLYFILKAIAEQGIDLYNTLRYDYDEPKERTIARIIMQDPQCKWTMAEVANRLFTTPSTLRRHLSKEGMSFSQLVLDVRMGVALNYLTFSNYSVLQVSHRAGFGSSAYFCDVFKRKYGVTPLQFRLKSRDENNLQIPQVSEEIDGGLLDSVPA
ncbi:helix-turn-helix transcriptional regulator [Photobacterium japonica]|uniref:helix-turn-helix transcriptional regulator n=1 Tax=Photobacterium japonica TaxID=2910235 RepID=UPI003D125D87